MRSFLTRLFHSVSPVVLLTPCLLVCLGCATPFPFEKLEEGMTTGAVREEFGAPEATEADLWGDAKSCWTYRHEQQEWFAFLLVPFWPFFVTSAAAQGDPWDAAFVSPRPVLLDFEEEKLVRWETVDLVAECAMTWELDPAAVGGQKASTSCPEQLEIPEPFPTCASVRGLRWLIHPSDG